MNYGSMSSDDFNFADKLPEHYTVLEPKICENCTISFTRKRGSNVKYCKTCIANQLQPANTADKTSPQRRIPTHVRSNR